MKEIIYDYFDLKIHCTNYDLSNYLDYGSHNYTDNLVTIQKLEQNLPSVDKEILVNKGDSENNLLIFHNFQCIIYCYNPIAIFYIYKKENKILVYDIQNRNDYIAALLVGPVMSIYIGIRGYPVIHGSAFTIDNVSYLCVGESGSGKSTFIASLIKYQSAKLISDDVFVIGNKKPLGIKSIKLWKESLEKFDVGHLAGLVVNEMEKYIVIPEKTSQHTNIEICKKVIFLKRDSSLDKESIRNLSENQFLIMLLKNIRQMQVISILSFDEIIENIKKFLPKSSGYILELPDDINYLEKIAHDFNYLL